MFTFLFLFNVIAPELRWWGALANLSIWFDLRAVASFVVDTSDMNPTELELIVLTKMELGRISSQRHHSWLASEYHLDAMKLLQNSMILSGNKKTDTSEKYNSSFYQSFCTSLRWEIMTFSLSVSAWIGCSVVRTSVSDRWTFRSICSRCMTTYMGITSAIGQPTRPTQPFILLRLINE